MNNEENNNRPPRRGPGHGPGAVEKPKDFKTSISKLFKSLGSFKIFILVALILAMGGAILSLSAPNKLSDFPIRLSVLPYCNRNQQCTGLLRVAAATVEYKFSNNYATTDTLVLSYFFGAF